MLLLYFKYFYFSIILQECVSLYYSEEITVQLWPFLFLAFENILPLASAFFISSFFTFHKSEVWDYAATASMKHNNTSYLLWDKHIKYTVHDLKSKSRSPTVKVDIELKFNQGQIFMSKDTNK